MRITVIKSDNQGIKALEMGRSKLALVLLVPFLLLVLSVVSTYFLTKNSLQEELISENAIEKWQQGLLEQRNELLQAKRDTENQVQALASRLATMQAHLLRLDATGSRLVTEMGINDEFAFDDDPALGGPAAENAVKSSYNDVAHYLDRIESRLASKEQQLEALESLILDKSISVEERISGRPIKKGWLSSPYGNRLDPFTGAKDWHPGIDFAALSGSDVIATAAGVVTTVGKKSGYGYFIEISHGDGFTTRYGHNKSIVVAKGDLVEKGQRIGTVGSTGRSTGPHVHYEITRYGKKLNPYKYTKK